MEARPPRRVSVREAQEAAYLDRFAAYVNGEVEAAQQQADADAQQAQAKAEEVAAELSIQNAELRAQLAELHAGRTEAMAEDDERVKLAQQAVTALVAMIESEQKHAERVTAEAAAAQAASEAERARGAAAAHRDAAAGERQQAADLADQAEAEGRRQTELLWCPKTPALAQPVTELKAAAVVAAETLGRNDMRPPILSDRSRAA